MASARVDAEADAGWPQLVEFLSLAGMRDGPFERTLDLLARCDQPRHAAELLLGLFPWNKHVTSDKHKGAARLRGALKPALTKEPKAHGSAGWLAEQQAQWRELRAVRVARSPPKRRVTCHVASVTRSVSEGERVRRRICSPARGKSLAIYQNLFGLKSGEKVGLGFKVGTM